MEDIYKSIYQWVNEWQNEKTHLHNVFQKELFKSSNYY